jgi:hypothetical protein
MDSKTKPAPEKPVPEKAEKQPDAATEYGGRGGLDPTRYGDWENGGKCVDF